MKTSGLVWFGAGFLFCLIWTNDMIGGLFTGVVTVVGGLVTFFVGLGAFGVGGVLVILGAGILSGRSWSERARGNYEAGEAWQRRTRYRD